MSGRTPPEGRVEVIFVSALLCSLVCITSAKSRAQDAVHQWNLTAGHVSGKLIRPTIGKLTARTEGPMHFEPGAPSAMLFSGDAKLRDHLILADDIAGGQLPALNLTVEAWVMIEKPLEWGGICGVIQDNGDFEKGWLLGYRNDRFSFAVSSQNDKKLTYLTDNTSFEMGFWYHVVGTYDGKNQQLYVDGKLRASSQVQKGPIAYPPRGRYVIGAYLDDDEYHPMAGRVEQIAVFNSALPEGVVARRFAERSDHFPEIHAVQPITTGWPTFMRDIQRTGISDEKLQFPLKLKWVHQPHHAPAPAWPPPAENDFWNRKYNLQPRVTFDRAYHAVSVGNSVYYGSSADCKVYCLDAATGAERWSFFTDGPVRLAPVIEADKLLFGSDDGFVYCLHAADGRLLWKYRDESVPERLIPGNERVINSMPIRSGILIEDGVAYFCAGLFPAQGVHQIAVDVNTGKELGRGPISVSAQGYLERRSGKLFVPSGRDPAGAFASQLSRRGKGVGKSVNTIANDYPYAFIGAAGVRIGGGDGKVAAFDESTGAEVWSAEVDGRAYGLAVSNGRVLVSTDTGLIYSFSSETSASNVIPPDPNALPIPPGDAKYEIAAKSLLAEVGIHRGYCLVLDSGEGWLAEELARQSDLRIVAFEANPDLVHASRWRLDQAGLYGRVVVQQRDPSTTLPFTDYMFNLIVSERIVSGGRTQTNSEEIERVLRPGGGVAVLGSDSDDVIRRAPLEGVGEWSHMYANTANTSCSTDQRVRGRMQLQWFGEPGPRNMLNRHHRTVAPLWKDGRLFIPGNDQVFASDAYNGTLLWAKEIPNSRRIAAFRDCSYMAAGTKHLYVAADSQCLALNAGTGNTEHVYRVPETDNGKAHDWGFVANLGLRLFGSGVKPGASRREHTRESIIEASYFDGRELVCSDLLFACNTESTAQEWTYRSQRGAIINSTITIGDGRLYFVESANLATLAKESGRNQLSQLMADGAEIVALSESTGELIWRIAADLRSIEHNLYVSLANKKLVLVGSRNSGTDKQSSRVVYEIHTRNAETGALVWQKTQTQATKIDGDHGEQDLHPVIVDDRLYCEPMAYWLHDGEPLADWGWQLGKRSGCGNISASASSFFFRESNPTAFDLSSKQLSRVTTTTRPGCLINIIPAGGLLLIPEASSGCTCDYGVQTSLAFLPIVE